MPVTINTDFPTGCLGTVESHAPGRLVVRLYRETAADGLHTQATWFHARFDGLDQPCELVLCGLRDIYEGQPGHSINERDKPVISRDGRTWQRLPQATFDRERAELTVPLPACDGPLWLANLEPYGPAELAQLAALVPASQQAVAGLTAQGRPLPMWTFGRPDAARCVWILARQHAWESHTSWCAEGLVRQLLAEPPAGLCVVVLPMVDPDGVVRGGTRCNVHGYDVNRWWDSTDPANPEHCRLRPEIAAVKRAMADWLAAGRHIDLCLNLHDTQSDVMGVPRPLLDQKLIVELHRQMQAAGYTGPLQADHTPGTVQHGLYTESGLVGALIELGTADLPGWDHLPTAADRMALGAAMARALA
ncbi:MAG: hypothetical protein HZB16_20540 [Armatimonadetes bacterium]|nr:hypothetical protein [Armatimonadota bacterium]